MTFWAGRRNSKIIEVDLGAVAADAVISTQLGNEPGPPPLGGLCETEGSPGRSLLASECGVGMWRAPYRRAMPHLILVELDETCQDGCAGGVGP